MLLHCTKVCYTVPSTMYALCEGTSSFPPTLTYLSGFLLFFSSTHRLYTGKEWQWGGWTLAQLDTFYCLGQWWVTDHKDSGRPNCLGPRDTLPVSIQNPLGYENTGFSWLWQEVHGSTQYKESYLSLAEGGWTKWARLILITSV